MIIKPVIFAFVISVVGAVVFMVGPSMAAERTVVLSVPDMECGSKEIQADMALGGLDGISEVKLDTDEKTATVTFDDEAVGVEDMKKALMRFDMPASEVSPAEGE